MMFTTSGSKQPVAFGPPRNHYAWPAHRPVAPPPVLGTTSPAAPPAAAPTAAPAPAALSARAAFAAAASATYTSTANAPPTYAPPPANMNRFGRVRTGTGVDPAAAAAPSKAGKMPWGEPFWTFFHTFAERIRPDAFVALREEIFDLVRGICANLPCPNCTAHATEYMRRTDWAAIRNKDNFRIFLCQFHNHVNARNKYAPFDPLALSDTYANIPFGAAANRFLFFFQQKHSSTLLNNNTFAIANIADKLHKWLYNHQHAFF